MNRSCDRRRAHPVVLGIVDGEHSTGPCVMLRPSRDAEALLYCCRLSSECNACKARRHRPAIRRAPSTCERS